MPDNPTPSPLRRCGVQPGNTNTLKHGFYARHLAANLLQHPLEGRVSGNI